MTYITSKKDFRQITPGGAGSQGYFTWLSIRGETETINGKKFLMIFVVCAIGTIATDCGQVSSTSPVKYCETLEEAVSLVNQLNQCIGAKDMSLPFSQCPNCNSNNTVQPPKWMKGDGKILFHCLDCNQEF